MTELTPTQPAGRTTASEAIAYIAANTGLPHGTVFNAARALREYDVSLWPQGAQGRGRAAYVNATHLANLAIALAAAEPLTEAPRFVLTYRAMLCKQRGWGTVSPFAHDTAITTPLSSDSKAPARFGEALETLIDDLPAGLRVIITLNTPRAAIAWNVNGKTLLEYYEPRVATPPCGIERRAILGGGHFAMLRELI